MKLTCRLLHRISNAKQKYVFMFGPPGVEKGTFAKLLTKDLAFNYISTGQEIRKIGKGTVNEGLGNEGLGNELDKNFNKANKSGLLSNDQIVVQIVKTKIEEPQSERGVIIEGFPRTQCQLENYLRLYPVHADILLQKLKGSRTCSNCGTVYILCDIQRDGYSIDAVLPKKQGVCDTCKLEINFKEEANQKVIKQSLQNHKIETNSFLYLFQKMGVLMDYEVKKGLKDYTTIKKLLETKIFPK